MTRTMVSNKLASRMHALQATQLRLAVLTILVVFQFGSNVELLFIRQRSRVTISIFSGNFTLVRSPRVVAVRLVVREHLFIVHVLPGDRISVDSPKGLVVQRVLTLPHARRGRWGRWRRWGTTRTRKVLHTRGGRRGWGHWQTWALLSCRLVVASCDAAEIRVCQGIVVHVRRRVLWLAPRFLLLWIFALLKPFSKDGVSNRPVSGRLVRQTASKFVHFPIPDGVFWVVRMFGDVVFQLGPLG
mmetsp:Transcript_13183/g.25228  ORF Transcript_13183/g.25228 Transcript_13183/m.25228 type:complete len:243 (+) Transcript_13183:225-953(+)